MKKPSSKIRQEIARLQEQLKQAETREAERVGRLALKSGLGEVEIEDSELVAALDEVADRFRKAGARTGRQAGASVPSGASQGTGGEA
jgi:DNA-binding protein H-NS